jgi:hypothetical protein
VSAEPPPPPQVSPDGKFYWDGTRWVPMPTAAVQEPQPVAESAPSRQLSPDGKYYWDGTRWVPMQAAAAQEQAPPVAQRAIPAVQAFPEDRPRAGYAAPKKGHARRNVSFGCLGLIVLLIIIAIASNGGSKTSSSSSTSSSPSASTPAESPIPSPTPISPAAYKASAKSIPYVQLEKDPASLAGTVVTYTGQVVQYDTATTTSNLRINVTPDGFGGYNDTIWLDVDPTQTTNVFRNTVIQFWGEVVGPYTYTSVSGGQITIPEVDAKYVQVVG